MFGNIVQATKTDTFSSSSTSFVDITGQGGIGTFAATITPTATTSNILIIGQLSLGANTTNSPATCRVVRGSTALNVGDASGSRTQATFQWISSTTTTGMGSFIFIDSPATTSATTYKWQVKTDVAGTAYVNRSHDDESAATRLRSASSIIVVEIPSFS
jgi:hypothetical protein